MNTATQNLLDITIKQQLAPEATIISVQEKPNGPQGYSGAELRYYDVAYMDKGVAKEVTLVTKEAALVERQASVHLHKQGVPVPFASTLDLTNSEPALLCMQHAGELLTKSDGVQEAAQALATIHYHNLGCQDELAWLPAADAAFADDWLIQACWRTPWQSLMAGSEFIDGYGKRYGLPKLGGNFRAAFERYTQPLEQAASKFRNTIRDLWENGRSLTLIHTDLHGDHIYTDGQTVSIIDWGTARYGSLYLDLPNYFTREEALLYRDALEDLGHPIPKETFLAYYDAVSPYPGFKYFGIGLSNWCYSDPPHQQSNVLHFINMIIEEAIA